MNCKACMDRASEYIEGGLTPEERADVQAHLSTCSSCAQVVGDVNRIVKALRALRRFTPSAAFDFVLRGVIRHELHRSRHRRSSLLRWLVPQKGFPLPVALLAALAVFLGVLAADGLWQSFSARRTAQTEEVSSTSTLASAESVTNHYVLERTTLEELRAGVADTVTAAEMDHAPVDTTSLSSEDWGRDGLEKVKLVTF